MDHKKSPAPKTFESVLAELAENEILEPFANEFLSILSQKGPLQEPPFLTQEEKELVLAYYAIEMHPEYLSPDAPSFLTQMTTATHEHRLGIISDARFLEMFRASGLLFPSSFPKGEKEERKE